MHGIKCLITDIIKKLLDFLEDKPTAYITEMQDFLFDEFDILTSSSTIRRVLQAARWSRKAISKRAAERSGPLRTTWQGRQKEWFADQLVFLDESAANERTGDRKYGWAPIGMASEAAIPTRRSERWSILPALTIDGYMSHIIYQGAINAELFEDFVEHHVLPNTTPYPGPRSIIVLDNANIHKSGRLRELCEHSGVILEFLPPYSPDFNPIEATFKDLKAWIRGNYTFMSEFESFDNFLQFAISQACGIHAKAHFRNSGYVVS